MNVRKSFTRNSSNLETAQSPPTSERVSQRGGVHSTRRRSAVTRAGLLTRTATGMNLKSVMLSERSQTRTSTHCKFPFMSNSRKDESNQEQQKADQWLPRSRGGWRWPGTGRAGTIQGAGSVRSVVTATGTCALVDTRVVQLKLVRFILCKLYLNQG